MNAFSLESGSHSFARPGDDNPTLRRPLLRLSRGRHLLMDPIFCRYAPMRLLAHAAESGSWRDRYLRQRDRALEERTGRILTDALKPEAHFHGVYLPVGKNGDLAEQDHIFIADGAAFFIECKAKRLRSPVTHEGNAAKVRDDLRSSVQVAFEQADRARRHLMQASSEVPLFDKHGRQTAVIDRRSIRSAHALVVMWESIVPLSIDLQPWMDVPAGTEYPWVVCVDDLQTALTRLRPATEVARFISWRSALNGRLFSGDEMPIVGCFLAGHTEVPDGNDTIMIDQSYGEIFDDDFFAARGIQRKTRPADAKPTLTRLGFTGGRPAASTASSGHAEKAAKPKRRFKERKRPR